jgi:alpha-L-rhamnosidase
MAGNELKLRHGEILNPDGSLYTANLRKAKAEIVYHKSESGEIYRPRFTYMGFRYVELTGVPYKEGLITAHAIYSDMERTGDFTCENPLVDRLFKNQVWGQKSNYVEVPTDCPQRDERMGYTGDGHVFAKTGAYNFDTEEFWAKFLRDISYSQAKNKLGYVAPTIPAPPGEQGVGFMSMLGWGNCICIIPELLYHHFGKDSYVKEYYNCMKKFVDLEISKMGGIFGKKNLWIAPSLGDWLAMGRDVKYMAMHNGPVSNAFIVNDLRIMIWASEVLGKNEDTIRYKEQLEKTREAYIKAFIKKDGTMRDDYQGAYVMALKMVVPRGELWDKIYAKLIEKLRCDGMQTGFFATEHILPLLVENGDAKLAFDLLLSPKLGGWMYQVERGATTTWERWDALRPDGSVNESKMSSDNMVSFNHYSFGSVGEFYYEYILGIKPLEPGFRKVQIKPFIDSRIGAFKGNYRGICVEYDNNNLHISVNTEAKIILPDGKEFEKCAGEYTFFIGGKDE